LRHLRGVSGDRADDLQRLFFRHGRAERGAGAQRLLITSIHVSSQKGGLLKQGPRQAFGEA
jgi:hypothetical protein